MTSPFDRMQRVPVFNMDGTVANILTAKKGGQYLCPDGHKIIVKDGPARERGGVSSYFSHAPDSSCRFTLNESVETELHKAAKRVICRLWTPNPVMGKDIEGYYPGQHYGWRYDSACLDRLEFYEFELTSELRGQKLDWLRNQTKWTVFRFNLKQILRSHSLAEMLADDDYLLECLMNRMVELKPANNFGHMVARPRSGVQNCSGTEIGVFPLPQRAVIKPVIPNLSPALQPQVHPALVDNKNTQAPYRLRIREMLNKADAEYAKNPLKHQKVYGQFQT